MAGFGVYFDSVLGDGGFIPGYKAYGQQTIDQNQLAHNPGRTGPSNGIPFTNVLNVNPLYDSAIINGTLGGTRRVQTIRTTRLGPMTKQLPKTPIVP